MPAADDLRRAVWLARWRPRSALGRLWAAGERMMGVKTTAKRDAQIRSARRGGLSLSEVGERFGISKQAVHMILRRDGETMPPDRRWGVPAEALCAGCGKLIRMSAAPLRTRRKRSLSG